MARLSDEHIVTIDVLKARGQSNCRIARKLGVTEDTGGGSLASAFFTNDLLDRVIYPDAGEVRSAWNRLGEQIAMTDQNGTAHSYARDARGRVIEDAVSAFGTDIDEYVEAIETHYDDFGRTIAVRSIGDLSSTPVVRNEVRFGYTPLWQVAHVDQSHAGAVTYDGPDPEAPARRVAYQYDTIPASGTGAARNVSRLHALVHPDGSRVIHGYGGSTSPDTRVSRVRSIAIEDAGAMPPPAVTVADSAFTGWSIPVLIGYPVPGVRLDRQTQDNGRSTAGAYAGYDRFGRVVRQKWVDDAYGAHGTSEAVPNIPAIVSLGSGYDRGSSRTHAYDMRTGSQWPMSHQYDYDELDRLAEARRGRWSQAGSTFTVGDQSQKWTLDPLGNWASFWASADSDPFGPGLFPSGLREDRTHNEVNELLERELPASAGTLDLTYDAAGNMTLQEREKQGGGTETLTYTWDAWNRLVRVEVDEDVRSVSEYNGLTHRTVQRADTTGNGILDQERRFTYDAAWRIAEELIDDDFDANPGDGPDRRVQTIWGNRYIDDLILRRIDTDLDGDVDHDRYHLTDVQFSTMAVIAPRTSQNARIHERVTYDAYGRARHHWGHDVNGDGALTTSGTDSDRGIIQTILALSGTGSVPITDAAYRAEADINRDGLISSADVSALGSAKSALAPGEISDRSSGTGPDSIIGWCGYVFIPETQFYHVRFRVYDTGLGRWKSRDPLSERGSASNLVQFVRGWPIISLDPLGLVDTGRDLRGHCSSPVFGGEPGHYAERRIQHLLDSLREAMEQKCHKMQCDVEDGSEHETGCTRKKCLEEAIEIVARYRKAILELRKEYAHGYASCSMVATRVDSVLNTVHLHPERPIGQRAFQCWSSVQRNETWYLFGLKMKYLSTSHAWVDLCMRSCDEGFRPVFQLDPWPLLPMVDPTGGVIHPSGPYIYPEWKDLDCRPASRLPAGGPTCHP
ncbi:MAG: hypothetical protein KF817_02885 [Phycisphaeraceae bacterium]|nr:hypothetical protein [Phycisphaeraceae bacterium]